MTTTTLRPSAYDLYLFYFNARAIAYRFAPTFYLTRKASRLYARELLILGTGVDADTYDRLADHVCCLFRVLSDRTAPTR